VTLQGNILSTSIEYLKGVGPVRADLLNKDLGIFTFNDLLNFFPYKYIDRTHFHKINQINEHTGNIQLRGIIGRIQENGTGRKKRLSAVFKDDTGSIELVWFKGVNFIKKQLHPNQEFIIYGKPTAFKGRYNIAHPEIDIASNKALNNTNILHPVYHSTEKLKARGIDSKTISKLTQTLFEIIKPADIKETLSDEILSQLKLEKRAKAYLDIHFPRSGKAQVEALKRLKFDEFFFLQLNILTKKNKRKKKMPGAVFNKLGNYFNDFYENHLPFELTNAQKRVITEIRQDVRSGIQMNRLVQGDVGSGKTMTALMCILMALDNGFQACLMAPTEILANQHFMDISEQLFALGIKVELLTGSVKGKKREAILERLKIGDIHILIGTHALIEDTVVFKNLALAVIDEQHRFGVAQRAKMYKKNTIAPHILVMTATPIPRTLALTMYGDLDTSVIDELPPGRKPIQTAHRYDNARSRVFGFILEEIKKGFQAYIVYPLIEDSEKMDYKDLMDGFNAVERFFKPHGVHTSIVHGKMKPANKDYEMARFVKGETQIMVATTVIEVGVNVPNATIMVIESTERFGLSQLHQLRGRVGRGGDQSYCILMSKDKLSDEARTRIEAMVSTTDGFKLSEIDLELRGPGDLMGTQQSGLSNLQLADLRADSAILTLARNAVIELIKTDPSLTHPNNQIIANHFNSLKKYQFDWGRIS